MINQRKLSGNFKRKQNRRRPMWTRQFTYLVQEGMLSFYIVHSFLNLRAVACTKPSFLLLCVFVRSFVEYTCKILTYEAARHWLTHTLKACVHFCQSFHYNKDSYCSLNGFLKAEVLWCLILLKHSWKDLHTPNLTLFKCF